MPIRLGGAFVLANCKFADSRAVGTLGRWKLPRTGGKVSDSRAEDALEFCALARKRWRSYSSLDRTATTLSELRTRIAEESRTEVAMMVLVVAPEASDPLGFCLFRRTWCNHIVLDLLATNPAAPTGTGRIGVGILFWVASVAEAIDAGLLWGEATESSAEYYRQWFDLPIVGDVFQIQAPVYRAFRVKYLNRWAETGLPADPERFQLPS
jgi:hypothetical protein